MDRLPRASRLACVIRYGLLRKVLRWLPSIHPRGDSIRARYPQLNPVWNLMGRAGEVEFLKNTFIKYNYNILKNFN